MMKNKKFRIFGITVVVVAALAAGFGGWYFMAGSNNYKNVFYPGTTLNDMNIEGMSVSELEEQLKESAKDYELVVDFKNEQLTIKGSDIQMAYNEASDLQALKDRQNEHKLKETDQKDLALTVNNLFTYNEERVKQELAQCSAMDTTKMIAPENAQLVYDAGKNAFSLRNGEQGTTLDEGEVTAAVEDAIEENVSKLDVEAKGLYQQPVLSEDSENANKILQQANAYLQVELKYPFKKNGEKKEEVINHEQISQWVYIDEDGTLQIDHDKVQEWVNGISEKYSSKKMNMDFTTTSGSVISLNVPVSGETLDTSALFEDVLKCLTDEVSGEREVPYTESASGIKKNFGGNYVEVDLTNQKLYLYKNSELIMSSNIVSGSVSQTHMTPTGVIRYTACRRIQFFEVPIMHHRYHSGCRLTAVLVSMMLRGEAVSAEQFISTMVPTDVSICLMRRQKHSIIISAQVIMLSCTAVSLMCLDRHPEAVHLAARIQRQRQSKRLRQRRKQRKSRKLRRRQQKQKHLRQVRQRQVRQRQVRQRRTHLRQVRQRQVHLRQVHRQRTRQRQVRRQPAHRRRQHLQLKPVRHPGQWNSRECDNGMKGRLNGK